MAGAARRGHDVSVELAVSEEAIRAAVERSDPDLIICPFLRQRVPAEVWTRYRTIIVHPGPKGDRGPSSLDWAITDGVSQWGVTALQAVEEMDAGPIWGTRTFPMPAEPPAKSSLYNGPVADAALELIGEVVDKAVDPSFEPEPLDEGAPDVIGRLRPAMRAADREFSWSDDTATIVRRIRAADGSPGVRTTLCDTAVSVFDAHAGPELPGEPGTIVRRHHDAVLVRTGDGSVWIGQVRTADSAVKLPATLALGRRMGRVIEVLQPLDAAQPARRSPGALLPAPRRRRRAQRRLLQRGDVDQPVPAADRRVAPRRPTADKGAAGPRRRRVLQRHPPQRHPRRPVPGDGGVAQHQRHRRRVPGDHPLQRANS